MTIMIVGKPRLVLESTPKATNLVSFAYKQDLRVVDRDRLTLFYLSIYPQLSKWTL